MWHIFFLFFCSIIYLLKREDPHTLAILFSVSFSTWDSKKITVQDDSTKYTATMTND